MSPSHRYLSVGFVLALAVCVTRAADPAPAASAADLATRLSQTREPGSSDVRLRMAVRESTSAKETTFQIQIKERRTPAAADVAYVVLWPRERKGEALLVRQSRGGPPVATHRRPDGRPEPIALTAAVFDGDLAVADTIENFFAWKNQALVGTETIDRANCQILESKPGPGDSSIYGRVRTWVDVRRMVPLRVEKYLPSGRLARRIETTRVVPQGSHGNLPANLTVRAAGKDSTTELDGSRVRWDADFSDRDFTPDGIGSSATAR